MSIGRSYRLLHKLPTDESGRYSLILDCSRPDNDEFLLFEHDVVAALKTEECTEFKDSYEKLADAYGCLGVLKLNIPSAPTPLSYVVLVTGCSSVGKLADCDVYRVTNVQLYPMWAAQPPGSHGSMYDVVNEIGKMLSAGMFYFAWSHNPENVIDLSLSAQKRVNNSLTDFRFFWNRNMHGPLQRYGIDTDRWLLKCMCGGVLIKTIYISHRVAKVCLVSRLSCERMGTRFAVRGTNDDGHVANFVETEMAIYVDSSVVSLVQTRGSVPLFWEQPGVQVGSHKVKLTRGPEATAPAFDRHFTQLKHYYGDHIVVNLLGSKEGERMLSNAFQMHYSKSRHFQEETFIHFDYHAIVKSGNKAQNIFMLWDKVKIFAEQFGFFHWDGGKILREQTGTIRTNCLDCLDRTNCAQMFFAMQMLDNLLGALDLCNEKAAVRERFHQAYQEMWVQNGDNCSKIYAGTGALEGRSKIKDASRSMARTIQNNVLDGSKQEAMDLLLLGNAINTHLYDVASALLPVNLLHGKAGACPDVLASVASRLDDFTEIRPLRIFCGTWNVNGGQRFNSVAFRGKESLADWLLDLHSKSEWIGVGPIDEDFTQPIDVFAIGLEEIVDLNAQNIMKASTANQKIWADAIKETISRDAKYTLLTSLQLVGVCLFVFVRTPLAPHVRDLSSECLKTGLGGAAGNKGCCAVRLRLFATSICFVCSHFAAGQSNVNERNNDFSETVRKLRFPMNRDVCAHDVCFWLGDFNYRVDLPGEQVKIMVTERNLQPLREADQLRLQMDAGNVFVGFREGYVNFAPTYKYDTFSEDYDTSEKCRTPAWTDRILWRVRPPVDMETHQDPDSVCRQLLYTRAELKTSDHRPVGAVFEVRARNVDKQKRDDVYREVVACMGPPDSTVIVSCDTGSAADTLLSGVLSKLHELHLAVLLVQFVKEDVWLVMDSGQSALAALSVDGVNISGHTVHVRLRSADWEQTLGDEMRRCRWLADQVDEVDAAAAADMLAFEADVDADVDVDDEPPCVARVVTERTQGRAASPTPQRPPAPAKGAPPKRPPPPSLGLAAGADPNWPAAVPNGAPSSQPSQGSMPTRPVALPDKPSWLTADTPWAAWGGSPSPAAGNRPVTPNFGDDDFAADYPTAAPDAYLLPCPIEAAQTAWQQAKTPVGAPPPPMAPSILSENETCQNGPAPGGAPPPPARRAIPPAPTGGPPPPPPARRGVVAPPQGPPPPLPKRR